MTQPQRTRNYMVNWKRKDIIFSLYQRDIWSRIAYHVRAKSREQPRELSRASKQQRRQSENVESKKVNSLNRACLINMPDEVGYYLQRWHMWRLHHTHAGRIMFPYPRVFPPLAYALCSGTILPLVATMGTLKTRHTSRVLLQLSDCQRTFQKNRCVNGTSLALEYTGLEYGGLSSMTNPPTRARKINLFP